MSGSCRGCCGSFRNPISVKRFGCLHRVVSTHRPPRRVMRDLCAERKLSAIINIHDVMLAQMFAERIVGLRLGEIVYDGPPDALTPAVLPSIHGQAGWAAPIRHAG